MAGMLHQGYDRIGMAVPAGAALGGRTVSAGPGRLDAVATDTHTVVIGGGVMGSAAAWALARRGVEVLLLEQYAAGHRFGSSHGSARIFRLAYAEPFYVRLARAALPLWRELEAASGCSS